MSDAPHPIGNRESKAPDWLNPTFTHDGGISRASFATTIGEGEVWFDHNPIIRVVVRDQYGQHAWRLEAPQAGVLACLLSCAVDSMSRRGDVRRPIDLWIEAHCLVDKQATEQHRTLYEAFTRWCFAADYRPMRKRAFADALNARGVLITGKNPQGYNLRGGLSLIRREHLTAGAPGASL